MEENKVIKFNQIASKRHLSLNKLLAEHFAPSKKSNEQKKGNVPKKKGN